MKIYQTFEPVPSRVLGLLRLLRHSDQLIPVDRTESFVGESGVVPAQILRIDLQRLPQLLFANFFAATLIIAFTPRDWRWPSQLRN